MKCRFRICFTKNLVFHCKKNCLCLFRKRSLISPSKPFSVTFQFDFFWMNGNFSFSDNIWQAEILVTAVGAFSH